MIDHDASGPAPHPESIDSSQCHDRFGFDRHEPAPLSVRMVGGAPIGRATVRSAHAREDVETPRMVLRSNRVSNLLRGAAVGERTAATPGPGAGR